MGDLLDQLGDGGRSIHELDKQRLSLARLGRKLTGRFKRKKKSSTIPVRTMQELWTPCKPPWKLNPELRLKLFALRRNWNLTSMSLKLLLTMPTRPMLRPRSLSSVTRTNFVKLKEPLRRSTANMSKSLRRQDLLSKGQCTSWRA